MRGGCRCGRGRGMSWQLSSSLLQEPPLFLRFTVQPRPRLGAPWTEAPRHEHREYVSSIRVLPGITSSFATVAALTKPS